MPENIQPVNLRGPVTPQQQFTVPAFQVQSTVKRQLQLHDGNTKHPLLCIHKNFPNLTINTGETSMGNQTKDLSVESSKKTKFAFTEEAQAKITTLEEAQFKSDHEEKAAAAETNVDI